MIYIIIPNMNGMQHLKTCIDSLLNQSFGEIKIVIVDNASTDGSQDFIRVNYPEIKILQMNSNSGFSKAVNEGIRYSISFDDCEKVLLLNNDVECDSEMVREMNKGFIADEVGSTACKMMNYYRRTVFDEAGHYIDSRGFPHKRGSGEEDNGRFDKGEFIFGACAGAAMYRKSVFEKTGLFDEDFFAYYEDVDFNLRMQLAGFKCYYVPSAVCYHKVGATSEKFFGMKYYLAEKNLTAVFIKNIPGSIFARRFLISSIFRLKRLAGQLFRGQFRIFFYSLKGYMKGIFEIPLNIKKRKEILKNSKVTGKYLDSLMES